MKIDRWSAILFGSLLVVGFAACSGDDGDDGNGNGTGKMDSGMMDTEPDPDTTDPDPDAGGDSGTDTGQDAGPTCEFVTNENCESNQNCYPDPPDGRQCLQFNPNNAEGEECAGGVNACEGGTICLQFEGQNTGTCRATCDPNDGSSCGDGETCIAPFRSTDALGACRPNCTLWPDDSCGDGQKCVPFTGGNQCQPFDSDASAGDSCGGEQTDVTTCGETQICAVPEGEDTGTCRVFCNEDNPCEGENVQCSPLQGSTLSVCSPTQQGGGG